MAERFPFGPSTRPECPGFGRGAMLSNDIKWRYKINQGGKDA